MGLCRSFMGTIRMRNNMGWGTLPSKPMALSPEEVKEFKGLESKIQNEVNILKEEDMLAVYKGYSVGQMVKVLNGKFIGEDGVIKRLKNKKLGVRLFTCGSSYDEWFDPKDMRLLTDVETLRGLTGPDKPIYNRDFQEQINPKPKKEIRRRPFTDSSGRNFRSVFGSGSGSSRNRRQDRVLRGDKFYSKDYENEQNEKRNWENYKRKQEQQQQKKQSSYDIERALFHQDSNDSNYNNDWLDSPSRSKTNTNNNIDFLDDIMMESQQKESSSKKKEERKKNNTR